MTIREFALLSMSRDVSGAPRSRPLVWWRFTIALVGADALASIYVDRFREGQPLGCVDAGTTLAISLVMKITLEVSDETVADYIGRAAISYWASVAKTTFDRKSMTLSLVEREPDANHDGKHKATRSLFAAGLVVMATKYPQHFADLIADKGDMHTGDLLIQCAIFGEEKYC